MLDQLRRPKKPDDGQQVVVVDLREIERSVEKCHYQILSYLTYVERFCVAPSM